MLVSKSKVIAVGEEFSIGDPSKTFKLLISAYSDPIGSLVREVTSNALDATTEAGRNLPVTVTLTALEFSVKDEGVGISPDRIRDVYMKLGSSTKDKDQTQIGGFGIGRFSPLSYTSHFNLITVVDGIKYVYQIANGDVPKLSLLLTTETEESNGTLVSVPIKPADLDKFKEAVDRQLGYMDNIYYAGKVEEFNRSKLLIGSHYIHNLYSSPYTALHICIGRVAYPLDSHKTNVRTWQSTALRFDIGELEVLPNREQIVYSDATIVAIQTKYKLMQLELLKLADANSKEATTLVEYLEAKDSDYLYLSEKNPLKLPKVVKTTYKDYNRRIAAQITYKPKNEELKEIKYYYTGSFPSHIALQHGINKENCVRLNGIKREEVDITAQVIADIGIPCLNDLPYTPVKRKEKVEEQITVHRLGAWGKDTISILPSQISGYWVEYAVAGDYRQLTKHTTIYAVSNEASKHFSRDKHISKYIAENRDFLYTANLLNSYMNKWGNILHILSEIGLLTESIGVLNSYEKVQFEVEGKLKPEVEQALAVVNAFLAKHPMLAKLQRGKDVFKSYFTWYNNLFSTGQNG